MGSITLYHGTPDKLVVPQYGGGDEKHDYGKGFYLTFLMSSTTTDFNSTVLLSWYKVYRQLLLWQIYLVIIITNLVRKVSAPGEILGRRWRDNLIIPMFSRGLSSDTQRKTQISHWSCHHVTTPFQSKYIIFGTNSQYFGASSNSIEPDGRREWTALKISNNWKKLRLVLYDKNTTKHENQLHMKWLCRKEKARKPR